MFKNFQIYTFYYSFLFFQILINLFQIFFPVQPKMNDESGFAVPDSSGLLQLQPIWIWLTVFFQIFIFFLGVYLVINLAFFHFKRHTLVKIWKLVFYSSLLVLIFSPIAFLFLFNFGLTIDLYNSKSVPFLGQISLTTIFSILQFILVLLYQKRLKIKE